MEKKAVSGAGSEFQDADAVRCYSFRPPYPESLYSALFRLAGSHDAALDIGCGTGKLAVELSEYFSRVVAVDPSEAIINAGRSMDMGLHTNIEWKTTRIEDMKLDEKFNLVTAGNSIHWIDHEVVFPYLSQMAELIAIVDGDEPVSLPCGDAKWAVFLSYWLGRMALRSPGKYHRYNPSAYRAKQEGYLEWIDVEGSHEYNCSFRQKLDEFIESQHSRATWSRSAMGDSMADEFDRNLRELLMPFSKNGFIDLRISTRLTWGSPRKSEKKRLLS